MPLYLSNEDPDRFLAWAQKKIGFPGTWPQGARALAALDGDTDAIRAVLVTVQTYDGIIDAHIASDGKRTWATRNILGGFFGYLFLVRGARRVQIIQDPENTDAVMMSVKLGFAFEGRAAAALDNGKDGVILSMTPDQCKWIKEQSNG